jgi:DNA (cytosine-5)-methyltransferase 1
VKVAALCAGYGGLELGLQHAGVDVELVWYAETDRHASQVMAHHHPRVPNLGDLTAIEDCPAVDIVTAGFPCQPVSMAGKRKGVNDERWLVEDVCRVARGAGANWLILENVAGIFNANDGQAFSRVVSALAENGFDARWTCVRASDVGAPHQRLRWFCVGNPADTNRQRLQGRGTMRCTRERPTRTGRVDFARWGKYTDAIVGWERVVGRLAPNPTDNKQRLNPRFVEWMMGLDDGHVTDAVDGRSHQLRILGNGVVPQQAGFALALLGQT